MRQLIGARVEFGVRQLLFVANDCRMLWARVCLLLEKLMETNCRRTIFN